MAATVRGKFFAHSETYSPISVPSTATAAETAKSFLAKTLNLLPDRPRGSPRSGPVPYVRPTGRSIPGVPRVKTGAHRIRRRRGRCAAPARTIGRVGCEAGPMARVLVSTPILRGCLDPLAAHVLVEGPPGSDTAADALVCGPTQKVDAAILRQMPSLRVIAVAGAGTDAIDHEAAAERRIAVLAAGEALR